MEITNSAKKYWGKYFLSLIKIIDDKKIETILCLLKN